MTNKPGNDRISIIDRLNSVGHMRLTSPLLFHKRQHIYIPSLEKLDVASWFMFRNTPHRVTEWRNALTEFYLNKKLPQAQEIIDDCKLLTKYFVSPPTPFLEKLQLESYRKQLYAYLVWLVLNDNNEAFNANLTNTFPQWPTSLLSVAVAFKSKKVIEIAFNNHLLSDESIYQAMKVAIVDRNLEMLSFLLTMIEKYHKKRSIFMYNNTFAENPHTLALENYFYSGVKLLLAFGFSVQDYPMGFMHYAIYENEIAIVKEIAPCLNDRNLCYALSTALKANQDVIARYLLNTIGISKLLNMANRAIKRFLSLDQCQVHLGDSISFPNSLKSFCIEFGANISKKDLFALASFFKKNNFPCTIKKGSLENFFGSPGYLVVNKPLSRVLWKLELYQPKPLANNQAVSEGPFLHGYSR